MKKYMFVLVGALIVVLALSGCVTNPNQPIRNLAATGNGKVYIAPDVAYINIGVHTEADSVADAINANSRQAEKLPPPWRNWDRIQGCSNHAFYAIPNRIQSGRDRNRRTFGDNTVSHRPQPADFPTFWMKSCGRGE